MLDLLPVLFWSITYVFSIIAAFQSRSSKKVPIPLVAVLFNFSWEICALIISRGFWGHALWLALDCVIVYFCFCSLKTVKQKVFYGIMIVTVTVALFYIFKIPDGMLMSVFIIDLGMAIVFIVQARSLSYQLKIPIAITKLLGDVFAGILCGQDSIFIAVIAILVFLCNLFYLCYCIEEYDQASKKRKKIR